MFRVKHLNPRQGITTSTRPYSTMRRSIAFACETPKSPPGDYNAGLRAARSTRRNVAGVKHLNPRQGITTQSRPPSGRRSRFVRCETPKSPPGDYNGQCGHRSLLMMLVLPCETPKSPPGDYNTQFVLEFAFAQPLMCETPKSPPGDYNRF